MPIYQNDPAYQKLKKIWDEKMAEGQRTSAEAVALLPGNCEKVVRRILQVFARSIPDYIEPQVRTIHKESQYHSLIGLKVYDDPELLKGELSHTGGFSKNEAGNIDFACYMEVETFHTRFKDRLWTVHTDLELSVHTDQKQIQFKYMAYFQAGEEIVTPDSYKESGLLLIDPDDETDCEEKVQILKEFIDVTSSELSQIIKHECDNIIASYLYK